MKRLLSLALLVSTIACTSVRPPAREPVHVVIVGTTDVHGWFNGRVETPPGGGAGVLQGGLASLAGYVGALRQSYGDRLLVVDSGDMFQGTLESNLFEGEAVVRGYNDIGYTAAAVGNHEFDFGPVGPDAIARTPGADPLGALKRNASLAHFPFLSANMIDRRTGRTPSWAHRYAIVQAGGAKIGIIGLSTPDTPNVTMSLNVVDLKFTDPVIATISTASELRQRGVDAIVVIAHMGGRCSNMNEPHSLDSCEIQHEAMEMLEKIPPGTIDGFFAGHTHAQMRHYVNGVPTLQASPYSREFSTLDLWIDTNANKVVKNEMRGHTMICPFVYAGTESCDPRSAPKGAALVPRQFEGRTIVPDARVAGTLQPYLLKTAEKRDAKTGIVAAAPLARQYAKEAKLGNVIADAIRQWAGSDFAFMNSGGIRADMPAGEITYGALFAVSPFDNYPSTVTMTGEQVARCLTLAATGARGILQVSGLRYTIDAAKDADKPMDQRERVVSVTLADGSELDPTKLYTVAMPDFLAAGGDGLKPVIDEIPKNRVAVSYAKTMRDLLGEILAKWPQPLDPKLEGRITILNEVPREKQ
jgi:5'-nucleotidase